jgi:hypothetical protein
VEKPVPAFAVDDKRQNAVAYRAIGAGETIAFLCGEIVSTAAMLQRTQSQKMSVDEPLQIDIDSYILLDSTSRLFRHSCAPNAAINGTNRLFALEDIPAGAPISYDFSTVVGLSYFDAIWQMECDCSSDNCRKIITSIRSLSRERLKFFVTHSAVPDFILRQLVNYAFPGECKQLM